MNRFYLSIIVIPFFLSFFNIQAFASNQHDLLTQVLSTYVSNGKINYTDLCKDQRLGQYTEQLNNTDPQSLNSDKKRFAFWLNAYNAYSLKAICAKYPIKSINDLNFGGLVISVLLKKSVWDKPTVMVNHHAYTLRQVDHEILRPTFKDPRIQFAIACGAVGCAPSRSDAYEADRLDQQLDDQAKIFMNDPRLNTFDKLNKTAALSPLLNWSRKDFGKDEASMLVYVSTFLPSELSESIHQNPSAWKISYNQYDLTLNDVKN